MSRHLSARNKSKESLFEQTLRTYRESIYKGEKCSNLNCKVSFYVSTFNSEETVVRSLESILNQQGDLEYCVTVVDDGSNDSTYALIEELKNSYSNLYTFRNTQNLGVIPAVELARLISFAVCETSKYIALGSDHDLWSDIFLKNAVSKLEIYTDKKMYVPKFKAATKSEIANINMKEFNSNCSQFEKTSVMRIFNNQVALQLCRAGHWMYGVERKDSANYSAFIDVDAPDQVYLYPLVYFYGVIQDENNLVILRSKSKAQLISRKNNHLISTQSENLLAIRFQNKKSRFITTCRQYFRIVRLKKKFGFKHFMFPFYLILKFNKVPTYNKLTIKYLKFVAKFLLNIFHSVVLRLRNLSVYINLYLDINMAKNSKLHLDNIKHGSKKLGLYVTTPGILRLLEQPIINLLKTDNTFLFVFSTQKSWRKKLTPEHESFIRDLKNKYPNFEIFFLPKNLSNLLHQKTKVMRTDKDRLELNFRFFSHPDLLNDELAAFRSYMRFGHKANSNSTLTNNELLDVLSRKYASKIICRFFTQYNLDLLMFSPVVNAHENEIIALSLKTKLALAGVVASWDNLSVKGLLLDCFDKYIVWSNGQKKQMEVYHSIDSSKIVVAGPYAFSHIFKYLKEKLSVRKDFLTDNQPDSTKPKILWLCSSAFIVDVKNRGKFAELDEIIKFITNLFDLDYDIASNLNIRLHPNCGYEIKEAVDYLNNNLNNIKLNSSQFTKMEAITQKDRLEYMEQLHCHNFVVGFATSSIVEAAIFGKTAISPISDLANRSYFGIYHGSKLLRKNGGPVLMPTNYLQMVEILKNNKAYSPFGDFADLIGLNLSYNDFDDRFADAIFNCVKGK